MAHDMAAALGHADRLRRAHGYAAAHSRAGDQLRGEDGALAADAG